MVYNIYIKGGAQIQTHEIELKEFCPQKGKKIPFGVAYLVMKGFLTIWTGTHHIGFDWKTSKAEISVDDIAYIETRSNDYESDEKWKLLTKGTSGQFSYKKAKRVTERIKKFLKEQS